MDQLDHNLLDAWHRVFERCKADPAAARRRYERTLPGTCLDRPARACCVVLRASDTRLDELVREPEAGYMRARLAHEMEVDAYTLSALAGPVRIEYPGVALTEAAAMLGRDYASVRKWLPVGAGRSRVERDQLAAKGMSDGRLIWATYEKEGYPLKVRYEPPGCHGRRGREVPVVWSEHALDPGAAKGLRQRRRGACRLQPLFRIGDAKSVPRSWCAKLRPRPQGKPSQGAGGKETARQYPEPVSHRVLSSRQARSGRDNRSCDLA